MQSGKTASSPALAALSARLGAARGVDIETLFAPLEEGPSASVFALSFVGPELFAIGLEAAIQQATSRGDLRLPWHLVRVKRPPGPPLYRLEAKCNSTAGHGAASDDSSCVESDLRVLESLASGQEGATSAPLPT